MREALNRITEKLSALVQLQGYYHGSNNQIRKASLGREIDKLMGERTELLEEIYADEDTNVNWYYEQHEDLPPVLED